jgi:hypothetical protein
MSVSQKIYLTYLLLDKAQLKKVQDLLRAAMGHKPRANDQDENQKRNDTPQKGKFVLEDTGFDPDDFFDDSWMEKKGEDDEEDAGEEYMEVLDAEGRVIPKSNKEVPKSGQVSGKNGTKDTENQKDEEQQKDTEENKKGQEEKGEQEQKQTTLSRDEVQVSTVDAFQGAEKGTPPSLRSLSFLPFLGWNETVTSVCVFVVVGACGVCPV